jgi:hypothetical protein
VPRVVRIGDAAELVASHTRDAVALGQPCVHERVVGPVEVERTLSLSCRRSHWGAKGVPSASARGSTSILRAIYTSPESVERSPAGRRLRDPRRADAPEGGRQPRGQLRVAHPIGHAGLQLSGWCSKRKMKFGLAGRLFGGLVGRQPKILRRVAVSETPVRWYGPRTGRSRS